MLMEVMFTIAIVGIALAPIFVLQTNSLRGLRKFSDKIKLIFPAKNFFIDSSNKKHKSEEKKIMEKKDITKPTATLTYTEKKIGEKGAFSNIGNINVGEVRIRSARGVRESIVGFIYKPEQEKK